MRPSFSRGLATVTLGLALLCTPAASAVAAELVITVDNLRNDRGVVRLAVWDNADGFTRHEAAIAHMKQPAVHGKVVFRVPGLSPGRYAIATYHDEDNDGEFDRTWIGLPDEGLGFSNGAWISLFGAPSFTDSAIAVQEGVTRTRIIMRYPGDGTRLDRSRSDEVGR